jgi:hypothetical protein
MSHLLCRGQATEPSQGLVYAGLYSSADPRSWVAPGEIVHLALSVAPGEGAPRGCGYLLEDSLADGAEVLSVQDVEYFPKQRWFRVRADAGETRTGFVQIRIIRPQSAPRLRPQITVAIPDASGRKLVRTGRLSDASLQIRAHGIFGLRITTGPNKPGAVNVLATAPPGSTVISATQPIHGTSQVSPDGWVTYLPAPGFTGYDRFTCAVGTLEATKVTAPVNVFVGSLDECPGVFPEHSTSTDFHHWTWPELTGDMPWPQAHPSSR